MFLVGQDYDRDELLEYVGSKQKQSGIIWGEKEKTCVIATSGGRGGKSLGYSDEKHFDGSISYIGQGEKGDQNPLKFANALLTKGERSVLFFFTREPKAEEVRQKGNYRKLYTFEGIFEVASWDFYTPSNGRRQGDKLVRFLLAPAENVFHTHTLEEPSSIYYSQDLLSLKKKILAKNSKPSKGHISLREYYRRSQEIIIYAKTRANGICECCDKPSPFEDENGIPFLEVHHILRLADDGPDEPENVAAVCPNCHREAHYGKEKLRLKEKLIKIIIDKEAKINVSEK